MTLKRFLNFFDFDYEKYEDGYGLIDMQGADLGNIEGERFENPSEVVERLYDSIYILDYIDEPLREDGYNLESDFYEHQYEWCIKNNHPFTEIIYTFLHPETITI